MREPGGNPNPDDWQERWLARFEVRIDKRIDDFQQTVTRRLDDQEKAFREHVERAGHSGEPELQRRMGRAEAWIIGLLTGLLTTIATVMIDLLNRVMGAKP